MRIMLVADQTNAIEHPIAPPNFGAPEPDSVFNLAASTLVAAEIWDEAPKSALFRAIVESDIYTAPADRHRAVDLRWVLRDIRGNRTRLLPVSQRDLRTLMVFGLVEIRDDAPALTDAGLNVIM
jgi:hypothetical protein